ncbi:hypothetical protein DN068_08620 [Taibaiella soli]|uniref:Uncharacterized protein n=2 Tax=Taibaiella soli TaxID=1649169 RepID=A0A2W2C050_9BACT|nr:hypothetical protein DN068_08620 [Taibaiella soli]
MCYTPMTGFGKTATAVQSGVLCVACTYADSIKNMTDANTNNYANFNTAVGLLAGNGVTVVDSVNTYPAGYEAGYVVDLGNGLLTANILSSFTVQTYNNGTLAESKNISNGLSVSALSGTSGKIYLNFKTTLPFNEVRFVFTSVVGGLSAFRIYYAMAFDSNCGNSFTAGYCYKQLAGNQTQVNFNGGLLNALVTLANPGNINDGDKRTYATFTVPAATPLLSTAVFAGVTDLQNVYPAGNKAGFMIGYASSLLTANVLNSLSIVTYLHGQQQDSVNLGNSSGTGITISALATGDTSEKEVSITTTKPFNEVRLVTNNTLGVNTGAINIYYAFESGAACTSCQQVLTSTQAAPYTGAVVAARTNTFGVVCIGQSMAGTANLVDASLTNFATYTPAILSVGCGGQMSVGNGTGGTFPANTFAGFALSRAATLLDLGILNAITINLYNAGTLVQSGNGASLLGTSLLNPVTGVTTVGIKATVPFNEVQIRFDAGLISAALGGTYNIYYAYVVRDDDGDGVPDCNEVCGLTKNDAVDTDGDGVPDACDACTNSTTLKSASRDTDGDGIADACDQDSDNDGISDIREDTNHDGDPTNDDADGDGIPNYLDLDSDNDGIPDLYESGISATLLATLDVNHDGVIDAGISFGTNGQADVLEAADLATSDNNYTIANADGDSVPDFVDLDSDNDGITDLKESGRTGLLDANGDGVVDGPDTDFDGIRDSADGNNAARGAATLAALKDTDGDGVADFRDLDSDNDGVNDIRESGKTYTDANNDGMADNADADGDGIMDSVDLRARGFGDALATLRDTDGDGVPNFRDLDSDNDGINDVKESGLPLTADANGDGMVDGTDTDGDGIIGVADGNTAVYGDAGDIAPRDTDGDGIPDLRDLDSDNDGINDVRESGLPLTADANGDGMVDGTDTDGDGIFGVADGNPAVWGDANDIVFRDTDGDGVPDARDLDSDNDGISDLIESGITGYVDANKDGVVDGPDTDGDGIQNSVDGLPAAFGDAADPLPQDQDSDGTPNFIDGDSNNDGINDITSVGLGYLDANGDGRVDNPIDPDGDGIANNDGLDFMPTAFGGLGPVTVVNVTALLQGALQGNGGGTIMRDNLRQNALIPLAQPYNTTSSTRFKQVGGGEETTNSTVLNVNAGTNSAVVDWVLIELRSGSKADSVVHTVSALIERNGHVVGADGNQLGVMLPPGTYYVSVKHRNHLGVMTATPVVISGQANTIDFTTTATYGSGAQIQVSPGVYAMWMGDVNRDGKIYFTAPGNDRDAQLVQLSGNQFGYITTYQTADINMDGQSYYTAPNNDRDLLLAAPLSGLEFGFIQEQLP